MSGVKRKILKRFTCDRCGESELVAGGTSSFICSNCKPEGHYTRTTQYEAHKAVARARNSGQLKDPRTLKCADCEGQAIEYDHRDYSKPLDVQPVCRRCNLRRGPAIGSPAYKAPTIGDA